MAQKQENRIEELALKWLEGTLTPKEKAEYNRWYNDTTYKSLEIDKNFSANKNQLKNRILLKIKQAINPQANASSKLSIKKQLLAAASFLLLMGVASVLYYVQKPANEIIYPSAVVKNPAFKNDVLPGSDKAILTLSSGKKVILDKKLKGVIATDGNTKIQLKTGEVVYQQNSLSTETVKNTMATPRGAQFQVQLSDGTKVWLNAESSITYPSSFKGNTREVSLEGEAYFEVAKNPLKPFIVTTRNTKITVLGTHFNINAYANEKSTKTTLLEGSVKVTNTLSGTSKYIVPGQQSSIEDFSDIKIRNINVVNTMAWKDGLFRFENTPLPEIMKQVARWYDVKVVFKGNCNADIFTGILSRNLTLTQMLSILQYTQVRFSIDKDVVTVFS